MKEDKNMMDDDAWMEIRALLTNEWSKTEDKFYKADILRSLMATADLDLSKPQGTDMDEFQASILSEEFKEYASIVDDINGVNNYADASLTLCRPAKNESATWTTGITPEILCGLLPDESEPSFPDLENLRSAMLDRLRTPQAASDAARALRAAPPSGVQDPGPAGVQDTGPAVNAAPAPGVDSPAGLRPAVAAGAGRPDRGPSGFLFRPLSDPEPAGQASSRAAPLFPAAGGGGSAGYSVAGQVRSLMASGSARGTGAERERSGHSAGRGPRWTAGRGREYGKRARNAWNDEPEEEEEEEDGPSVSTFKTAKEQLITNHLKNRGYTAEQAQKVTSASYGGQKKSLGARRGCGAKFVPPVREAESESVHSGRSAAVAAASADGADALLDERLKNIEPRMVELITSEIMDRGPPVAWDDIAGLQFAKNTIKEMVIWPLLRPDIFTGLRGLPKGLLLFGPPGTGKTLIGKCIASQSRSTFFSISASSLTSKWVGEGEKMVRALFAVARCHQPAVVFIDEIDSLLSQRSESEHESSRRIKTEFLVQLDGAGTSGEDRLLVVGATNRPQELDEAARRRLVKRLYVPLPDAAARRQIVENLLRSQRHQLSDDQLSAVAAATDGYSGADVANLCREAALGPIRCIGPDQIHQITPEEVRPLIHEDFVAALANIRASVSQEDLQGYVEWNRRFGTGGAR